MTTATKRRPAAAPPAPKLREDEIDAAFAQCREAFKARDIDTVVARALAIGAAHPTGMHPLDLLLEDAIAAFRHADMLPIIERCLDDAPNDPRLWDTKGHVLTQLGQPEAALAVLAHALSLRPGNQSTRTLISVALFEAGRLDDAIAETRSLIDDHPDANGGWSNLASMLVARGDFDEALSYYQRSVRLKPDDARIRLNHSIGLLKAGRFTQGWTEHEWRLHLPGHTQLPAERLLPNITADLDLRGKRILVTQEEGLGDTLMYLRFLAPLARRGAHIIVWGHATLNTLTARIDGVAETQVGGDIPAYDYHCPFISLPRAFAGTDTPFGDPVPYIRPDPLLVGQWRQRLAADRNLRVGLVWAGASRPDNIGAYMVDRRRSMPVENASPFSHLRGVSLYNLQKGATPEQLAHFNGGIVDYMTEIGSMDDTAALIANLDVVVSVDTSMVHLAGGLGSDVLMMDRLNNCWRWQFGRSDSPWYPNMRIIRQTRHMDWSDVVARVCDDLRARAGRRA